jgi:hypothetical protein
MLQGRTCRINVGYRQHSTLITFACKHARVGRFVFDKPTLGPMLVHRAQECGLQVAPRRKQINRERTSARGRYDEPPYLTAWDERIQLTSPASRRGHTSVSDVWQSDAPPGAIYARDGTGTDGTQTYPSSSTI